ncbi:MAG: ECF transporter S component [Acholeplasmataceae bacterium]
MNNTKHVQRLTLAASLASVSIVIDILFKMLIQSTSFGVPFYAIPIILGSIILGPAYGLGMALVSDLIGVNFSGQGYLPLFALSAVAWGVIPGVLIRRRFRLDLLAVAVFLAYLAATTLNTIAILYYFGRIEALSTLALRLSLVIFNSVIIFYFVKDAYRKLTPFYERFVYQT